MAIQTIQAPFPGTFYRRPAPDQPPYKNEGDTVAAGDVVGIIEVMKTFTQLASEMSGRVVRFLAENDDPIMAGQAIVEIEV